MSTWRQKAIECAPELRTEFQATDLTPYTVFMELLPLVKQAHINNDKDRLKKIYGFAAWCLRQKEQPLWNAASVTFYEHLTDQNETYQDFTSWITKEVYLEIRGLLEMRAQPEQMKHLDKYYGINKKQ